MIVDDLISRRALISATGNSDEALKIMNGTATAKEVELMFVREIENAPAVVPAIKKENKRLKAEIKNLRDLVWSFDIPHPTTPEYRELHEKMRRILKFIDKKLLKNIQI